MGQGVESWRGQIPATDGDRADGDFQVSRIFSNLLEDKGRNNPFLNPLTQEGHTLLSPLLRNCQMTSLGSNRDSEIY